MSAWELCGEKAGWFQSRDSACEAHRQFVQRRRFGALRIVAVSALVCAMPAFAQTAAVPDASRPETAPSSSQPSVTETQWNLIELDGAPVTVVPPESQPYIYLQTQADKLSGSGGCNRFFGSYDLSGSSLQFHSVAQTLMACKGASMAREPALLEALRLTTGFQISGNILQLRVDDRVLARFQARKK